MEKASGNVCPRCLGGVPNDDQRGAYPGALSRVADVEICSLCGEDEAVAILFTQGEFNGLVPQSEWPIDREAMLARLDKGIFTPLDVPPPKKPERGPAALEARFKFGGR